jgi:tetratricopeptide (TPR) repeat protein
MRFTIALGVGLALCSPLLEVWRTGIDKGACVLASLKYAVCLFLLCAASPLWALDQAKFDALLADLQSNQLESVTVYLDNNAKSATTDPDYTILLLNHALLANRNSQLIIAQGEGKEGDIELNKTDDPKIKGFIREQVNFDSQAIRSAIHQAQTNLKSFPEYLDIYLGIAAVASRVGEWQVAADQLIEMLKVSREINNQWKWGKVGGMSDEPEEFMIQGLLPYGSHLLRLESPEGDRQLIRVSEALIQYYPKKVYGYAYRGSVYAATGKTDKAREYYEKALKIDPNDEVVKGNIENLAKWPSRAPRR